MKEFLLKTKGFFRNEDAFWKTHKLKIIPTWSMNEFGGGCSIAHHCDDCQVITVLVSTALYANASHGPGSEQVIAILPTTFANVRVFTGTLGATGDMYQIIPGISCPAMYSWLASLNEVFDLAKALSRLRVRAQEHRRVV